MNAAQPLPQASELATQHALWKEAARREDPALVAQLLKHPLTPETMAMAQEALHTLAGPFDLNCQAAIFLLLDAGVLPLPQSVPSLSAWSAPMLDRLLALGVDMTGTNSFQETALHCCASHATDEHLVYAWDRLLFEGVDPSALNNLGKTAEEEAAIRRRDHVVHMTKNFQALDEATPQSLPRPQRRL